jgi:hypothetical protein
MPEITSHAGAAPDADASPRLKGRGDRFLWVALWSVMMLAPAIMLSFTASQSKVLPAVGLCVLYLCWRFVSRPHPPLRNEVFALSLVFVVYLCLQGAVLCGGGSTFIIILLQGQWAACFLAGLFLAYDIARTRGGLQFLSSAFVWISAVAAICGIISVWTGPFYAYGHHAGARWGLPINRAIGTFDGPASLSSVLELGFLLEYFSPSRGSALRRTLMLSFLGLALFLTFAKGAIVTCLMVAGMGGLAIAVSGGMITRTAAVLRVAAVCAAGAGILWLANSYDIDITQLIQTDAEGHYERGTEVLNEYFTDDLSPQLFGIGFRQSSKLFWDEMIWYTAHNSYISFLREIGGAGTLIFLALIACLLRQLYAARYLAWMCSLIAILLLAYTETFLNSDYLVCAIGAAVGLVCAAPKRPRVASPAAAVLETAPPRDAWQPFDSLGLG